MLFEIACGVGAYGVGGFTARWRVYAGVEVYAGGVGLHCERAGGNFAPLGVKARGVDVRGFNVRKFDAGGLNAGGFDVREFGVGGFLRNCQKILINSTSKTSALTTSAICQNPGSSHLMLIVPVKFSGMLNSTKPLSDLCKLTCDDELEDEPEDEVLTIS